MNNRYLRGFDQRFVPQPGGHLDVGKALRAASALIHNDEHVQQG